MATSEQSQGTGSRSSHFWWNVWTHSFFSSRCLDMLHDCRYHI